MVVCLCVKPQSITVFRTQSGRLDGSMKEDRVNVADAFIQILAAHGVSRVFGIPGDAINDVTDAIRRQDEIAFIGVRHEEAGA